VLNSSDDFVARRGILGPPRRRVLCEFQLPTADTSQPEAGTRSSVGDLHKSEGGSLVEAAERSLRPYPRKPLFCSTPSASLCERPRPKSSAATLPPAASPHGTMSHLSLFSTSQELDLDSLGNPFRAPNPAPLSTLCTNVGDIPTHTASPTVSHDPLRTSLAWEEAEDGSHFVSASAGLGLLVDALKRACLTVPCTIRLEKVESLIPGLQHTSQSASSSCLDPSGSGCLPQTPSPMGSAEDGHLVDSPRSEEDGETLDPTLLLFSTDGTCEDLPLCFQPDVSTHGTLTAGLPQPPGAAYSSTDGASAVRDSEITSVGHTTRQEDSIDPSVIWVDSSLHIDDEGGGGECASSTQSLEDSPPVDKAAFTDSGSAERMLELRATLKEECLLGKCSVLLQRLAWPQQPVTAPFRTEVHGCETVEHEATPSKSNTAIKTDPLKHKHLRRSTARSTTAIPSPSSPDRAQWLREPAAVPMLVHRWTPDLGRCLGNGPAPESLEPSHHAGQRDGPRRLSKRTTHGLKDAGAADPPDNPAQRRKLSAAPREQEVKKKRAKKGKKGRERSVSKDRSGTARKACISGLSVSRWKDQSSTSGRSFHHSAQTRGASRAGDGSITELSAQHKPSKVGNVI